MKKFNLTALMTLLLIASKVNAVETVLDIPTPEGFVRTKVSINSFSNYLRSLPLKQSKKVTLWDGRDMPEYSYEMIAVIDLPLLFNEDLEQCADFGMRLWAEYLKSINSLDKLSLFDFYGRKKPFIKSQKSFQEYLRWHMKYSNSYSIKLGAKKVRSLNDLRPGDMFVQNDSEEGIGHVSVVIDEAIGSTGIKVFLVGYSYMPAQQFHIEKAGDEYGFTGWFSAEGYLLYAKRTFGNFGKPIVKRFEKDISH